MGVFQLNCGVALLGWIVACRRKGVGVAQLIWVVVELVRLV
jgi:hypothetical protein